VTVPCAWQTKKLNPDTDLLGSESTCDHYQLLPSGFAAGLIEGGAMAALVHLRREVHPPENHFSCPLQVVDGLALQNRQEGTEGVLQDLTLLSMRTL
jgi:hypothetical protein